MLIFQRKPVSVLSPFHGGNPGSIPGGVTITSAAVSTAVVFLYSMRIWWNWQTRRF